MKHLTVTESKIAALVHPLDHAPCKVVDHPLCCMEMQSEKIDEQLMFMTCKTHTTQAVRVSMTSDYFAENVGIGFVLEGQKMDYLQGWSSPQKMDQHKLILCYAPKMTGYVEYQPNSHTLASGMYLKRASLLQILKTDPRPKVRQLFAPIFDAPHQAFCLQASMTPAIVLLLQSLQQHHPVGFLNAFSRKSKVYELLHLTVERIVEECCDDPTDVKLSVHDVLKLAHAKDILAQNLQAPISLMQLAKRVGLNEFKLKRGFKQLNGKTVFQYLNELRMHRAAYLCLHSDLSIVQISHEVGYCNHGHFSIAFRKMYGQAPSKYRKDAPKTFHLNN